MQKLADLAEFFIEEKKNYWQISWISYFFLSKMATKCFSAGNLMI